MGFLENLHLQRSWNKIAAKNFQKIIFKVHQETINDVNFPIIFCKTNIYKDDFNEGKLFISFANSYRQFTYSVLRYALSFTLKHESILTTVLFICMRTAS